jgi:hypothetical protein
VLAGLGQGFVVSPLLRVILSDVPVRQAGAGAGVLATAQQTSLAFGVALVGSLFSALISPLGVEGSALVVIAVVVLTASFVAVASRRLPSLETTNSEVVASDAGGESASDSEDDSMESEDPDHELVFELA